MTEQKQEAVIKKEHSVEFIPFGATDKLRLTASMVRAFIAIPTRSGALPTERDCIRFIMLCKGKRLNPFEGDAFMIGFDTDKGPAFSMVTGIEAFLKRSEQNPSYDGIESGVIIQKLQRPEAVIDNDLEERQGSLVLTGEKLIGGWAKVYRKDQARPVYKTAKLETYDTGKSRWVKDPGGMIEKVAKSQALREAFPTPLGGLYTQEEMEKLTQAGDNLMLPEPEPIAMPTIIEPEPETEPESKPERSAVMKVEGTIDDIKVSTGTSKKGVAWTKYAIQVKGEWYSTFNTDIGETAKELRDKPIVICWSQEGKYKRIDAIYPAQEIEIKRMGTEKVINTIPNEISETSKHIYYSGEAMDEIQFRIGKMKEIDPELYKKVTAKLGILPMSLDGVERIEQEFNKELDAR